MECRARKIEQELAVADRQGGADRHRLAVLVAVEIIDVRIGARRQAVDRGGEPPLGEVQKAGDRRGGAGVGVFLEQRLDALDADEIGGELRTQVADALLGRTAVEQDDVDDVAIDRTGAHDSHERQSQALLEDRAAHRGFAARHHAADVGVVRDVGHEGDDAAVAEHRRDHVDVGQVRAAAVVGIVGDEHVARLDLVLRKARAQGCDRADHRAEMDRHAVRLGDHVAVGIEDRRRAVRALLDVGRERRAGQRRAHLLGGEEQIARHRLGGYRVCCRSHWATLVTEVLARSSSRLARASTRTVQAGGTTVVASICSTIAGPANVAPIGSAVRR